MIKIGLYCTSCGKLISSGEINSISGSNVTDANDLLNQLSYEVLWQSGERMDDLISRQAAISVANSFDATQVVRGLEKLSSINPEQKIGKWEYLCHQNMKCSECGYVIAEEDIDEFHYCPNCGTKMEDMEVK